MIPPCVSKFRARDTRVEAMQLEWATWSQMCTFAGVGALEDNKPQGVTPAGGGDNDIGLAVPFGGVVQEARGGDWIVKDDSGQVFVVCADEFLRWFEPLDQQRISMSPGEACVAALRELVATKDMQDATGKTPEYEARRDAAWSAARLALKVLP